MVGPGEPQAKRARTEALPVVSANECITFHLLKRSADTGAVMQEEDGHFPPEMTHQLFGDEESIKGYDGLEIDVFLTPRFQALIDVKYAGRSPGATDLAEPFKDTFGAGFFEDKAAFDAAFDAEPALAAAELGEVVESAETEEGSTLQVVRANLAAAPHAVRDLHAHLQPLLRFFVDAYSPIDASDPNWELLLVVETPSDGSPAEVLGLATLYSFWVFPDRRRLLVAQVLVLPPHQGRGAGSLLLRSAYKVAEQAGAVDIPFEDPTEELQRMRDRLDLSRMLPLDWLREEAEQRIAAVLRSKGAAPAAPANGAAAPAPPPQQQSPLAPSPELLARLQRGLRLGRAQARRMWETLLFAVAVPLGPGATAAVEGMVRAGLEAEVAAAKKDSRGKSLRNTPGSGEPEREFVMFRGAARGGTALAGAVVPVEGISGDQRHGEIEEAVAGRVEELRRVVGRGEGGLEAIAEEGEEAG